MSDDTHQSLHSAFVFLSIAETARRLGISRYYIRKMLADGELAGVMIAGRLMVSEASVTIAQTRILQQLEPYAAVA